MIAGGVVFDSTDATSWYKRSELLVRRGKFKEEMPSFFPRDASLKGSRQKAINKKTIAMPKLNKRFRINVPSMESTRLLIDSALSPRANELIKSTRNGS